MNKKRLVVAFSGPSNSGKTTAIVKVSNILQDRGFKVCIIKHDPKDKAMFDRPGKDSFKFGETGADVAVVSPNKTTLLKKQTSTIDEMIDLFDDFDYLLVEGLKTLDLPRISIFRNSLNEDYFKVTDAIASDDTINDDDIPSTIDRLNLNSPEDMIIWIDKNAKRV
ncbi:molybdopterin-guanine dinucleotide biosynthesis protein B [Poseidonibacter ostreae]|jgi:molybdopterin-guanine dinucleotide biosynthesis adapter protein|uniref:Molybdopterin-guanine dinucleotide biosynthesis protein B n=1 Tax=Poseidonibacter ostreae TaxID=2654171 RepID=A0A6L4WVA9_9BACT|nr:molybdopterin-guanine dinucleotide biosynthesis protein B [Poseidonibacter ostreae]KAB7886787.1 molybdopterin-guanine dinucleotide biosynthesis protein B [Poseidonibacter ostreae]KAB7890430.1 molybdopterin-guanine dinucleotide biosynthesis protein B [Poseidonibacter ostreae]KAB7892285.1 molybdopterin-guanine dinucleotide biosynthesis protein B [Poseidonibacter ostreae]MAC85001.1 molybdopterin-guanine dinucleotide biosynthesis protein B [Arcobacter sp.]